MLGWWIGGAFASPGSAGMVHLGALPMDGSFAGAGTLVVWTEDGGAGIPVVEGGAKVSDRVAVTGMAGLFVSYEELPLGLVSGRYLVVDNDDVRFAVTGQLTILPKPFDPPETHLDPGLAIDVGGPKVRFDAAVPLWGVSFVGKYFGPERFRVPEILTLGVNVKTSDRGRFRFGLPELFSWSYRSDQMYFDIGGVTVLVAGAVWTKIGVVF